MANQAIVDAYSIVHAGSGVIARVLKLSISQTIVLHTIFEVLENQYLKFQPWSMKYFPDPVPDTLLNSIGDTVSAILGWYAADRYGGLD